MPQKQTSTLTSIDKESIDIIIIYIRKKKHIKIVINDANKEEQWNAKPLIPT